VLICGYGRSGQALARLLETESIAFFALDIDPERVHEAAEAGDPVVFGDAGKKEVLMAAGVMRARVMVIAFADTAAACRIMHTVRSMRADLPVIVRTLDDSDIDELRRAGADEVVPEMMEGSLMLATQALMEMGLPLNRVLRRIRTVREERYNLFRGFFRGASDDGEGQDDAALPRLFSLGLCEGAYAIGLSVATLDLPALGVELKAVRRQHSRLHKPGDDFELQRDDVLVLLGNPGQLARAEERVLSGV